MKQSSPFDQFLLYLYIKAIFKLYETLKRLHFFKLRYQYFENCPVNKTKLLNTINT